MMDDYGVSFDVSLDCCWSKKQAKRKIRQYKARKENYKRQSRKAAGLDRGGFEFIRRGASSSSYMWKAAYYQKRANKMQRKINAIRKCKKYPCFPNFKKSWKKGFGDVGDLMTRQIQEDDANFAVSPLEIVQPSAQVNGWGYIGERHRSKLDPWIARLVQASKLLEANVRRRNRPEAIRSFEDVSFWQGRIVCDLLGSETNLDWNKLAPAFIASQRSLAMARSFLG